jgi:haloalkane dehalogenase
MRKNRPIDMAPFRHLYPFKPHFLDVDCLQYHYIDEGSGEPIVMVHGNPTWSFYYRELVKAFSSNYRTIVPDHIGCGLSDKPDEKSYGYRLENRIHDLDFLIDAIGLNEKITLVVHDWGGMIGMAYALRYPEKIMRLIILNTAAFLMPAGKKLPLRLRLVRNFNGFARLAVLGLNLFSCGALYMAASKRLPIDVKAGLKAPYNCWANRIATLKFVQDIPMYATDPSYATAKFVDENLYRLIEKPMLICWGMNDFVFDRDYLSEWQRRFPDAEVHKFPDTGHYVLEDVPEKIVVLMDEFLKRYPTK